MSLCPNLDAYLHTSGFRVHSRQMPPVSHAKLTATFALSVIRMEVKHPGSVMLATPSNEHPGQHIRGVFSRGDGSWRRGQAPVRLIQTR